jgi:pimeloyl-ACP methyl ester carboxylesterase
MRTVTVNGVELAYLEAGPADGPLALCLHGFPDTANTWRHLLPRLGEAGYHAVAPWLRGYAPSGLAPDCAYQVGALASDANGIRDAVGGDGAVLIGHDWGALATYAAIGAAPERWRQAVVMAIPPLGLAAAGLFDYDNLKQRQWYQFFFCNPLAELAVMNDGYAFLDRLWADWSPGYDASDDLPAVKEALGDPARVAAALGLYRTTLGGAELHPDYASEQAAAFQPSPTPVLYLHGLADGCMAAPSQSDAEAALAAPGSQVVLVEGAGHFLQLEQPDTIGRLVLDFLER